MNNIIDFQKFRTKKDIPQEVVAVKKSESSPTAYDTDLAQRIERIKDSIQRINQLMLELRTVSPDKGK